jgi:transcriptional regulator GlxA family with amidase domain
MPKPRPPVTVKLLAVPETTASILYAFHDVFSSFQSAWSKMSGKLEEGHTTFEPRIVSPIEGPFRFNSGIPAAADETLRTNAVPDVVIVPDVSISLDDDPRGRWPEAVDWLRRMHDAGATVCSVCTGSLLLADAGLLDGRAASTHWAYVEMFRRYYPDVDLQPEKLFVPGDASRRVITTGGPATWEELALYLIARYAGEAAAVQASKVFLLGDRGEGQLVYAALLRPRRHEDAVIADAQAWIADNYALPNPVARLVKQSGLTERTFKRRFTAATGYAPIDYVQTMRIEEAKQLLESSTLAVEQVGTAVGYEDPTFFRRLFKRSTGVTPSRYRQRFGRIAA